MRESTRLAGGAACFAPSVEGDTSRGTGRGLRRRFTVTREPIAALLLDQQIVVVLHREDDVLRVAVLHELTECGVERVAKRLRENK